MAKFEIVRTEAGYHGVLDGGNGEPVWTTEVHPRKEDVANAIRFLKSNGPGAETFDEDRRMFT